MYSCSYKWFWKQIRTFIFGSFLLALKNLPFCSYHLAAFWYRGGSQIIWIAPSGGRDRPDPHTNEWFPVSFSSPLFLCTWASVCFSHLYYLWNIELIYNATPMIACGRYLGYNMYLTEINFYRYTSWAWH